MNKETKKVINFIESNPETKEKLETIIEKHGNSRDFMNQMGYLVMEIVNTNKEFYMLSRNKLEIELISERYFG